MKKLIIAPLVAATFSVAHAQYLDDLNALVPTGANGVAYTWTDPVLGKINATWSGTSIYAVRNAYFGTVGDTTSGAFGIYDGHAPSLSNTDDVKLTFEWSNPVTQFDLTVFDWDAATANPTDTITFGNVDTSEIIGIGSEIPSGFVYTDSANTVSFDNTSGENLSNGALGTGYRVSLTNDDDSSFTSFSIEHTTGSDFYYVGGTTASIPEPSSTLLISLGALAGFTRRRR